MHNSNLIIVDDASKSTIHPDLFSAPHRNIGIFGENQNGNNTLLKNIVDRAVINWNRKLHNEGNRIIAN